MSFEDDLAAVASISAVDKLLETACRATGMGFAAIARVTADRWVAMAVRDLIGFGLKPGGELVVTTTICDSIRQSGKLVVIDHVSQDELFKDHPTPRTYGFESYISVPIVLPDGTFFGTICAIDPSPAKVNRPEVVGMFTLFAELVAMHLQARRHLDRVEQALATEKSDAELRDQFIAVLGHDLRNPLAAIDSTVELLLKRTAEPTTSSWLKRIQLSSARMNRLIEDVLDFARGKLGGGIPVHMVVDDLSAALRVIVLEARSARPDRIITADIESDLAVRCDSQRLAQMLSNFLGNAMTHGDPQKPIEVSCHTRNGTLRLAVTNSGSPIAEAMRERLFQPFVRGEGGAGGLGLGLFICAEIAKAHRGHISVRSDADSTVFAFEMPV